MGCWHGCGPVHCGPEPRGWYGLADEDDWNWDVNWLLRCCARAGQEDRDIRAASLEKRLDGLREDSGASRRPSPNTRRTGDVGTAVIEQER